MKVHRSAVLVLLVAALVALDPGRGVQAQESDKDKPEATTEIVVTVTAPPLPDLGPLETELPAEESALPERSLPDLLVGLPGLSFDSFSEEPRQAAVRYRGYGGSHLPLVVDGHRVNPPDLGRLPWGSVPVAAVESARLLRGPQAVRYGSGAITGALVVETTPAVQGGYLRGGVGSFGYRDVQGGATVEAGETLVSASGELFRGDGQRANSHSSGGSTLATVYRQSVAPTVGSPLELRASIGFSQLSYGLPGAVSPDLLAEDPDAAGTPEDRGETTRFHGSGSFSWLFSEADVTVPVYFEYRADDGEFVSFSTTTRSETATARVEPSGRAVVPGLRDLEVYGGISGELVRLASTAEATEVTDQTFDRPALGIYGGGVLPLSGAWALEAGARYDLAVLRAEGALDETTTLQGTGGDLALHYDAEQLRSTLRVAAVYRLPKVDEIALYQGFGTGFNTDLSAERGTAIDIGVRIQPSEAVSLRAGVFGTFLRDEIAFVFDPTALAPPYGQNENIDSTRRLGVESDLRLLLADRVELFGGYSFVDPRYASGDNEGNIIAQVPRHSTDASVLWRPTDWLDLRGRYHYFGRYYDTPTNDGDPEYRRDLLSFGAAFTLSGATVDWSLGLSGENLLDDRDPSVAFPSGVYPSAGRRYLLSLGGSY